LAYSLNDLYSGLRSVMRTNGLVIGFAVGLLLLLLPRWLMTTAGLYAGETLWPYRLIGGLLLALGILLLLSAQDRVVSTASMVTMIIANGSMAVVLVVGYLQGEFAGLGLIGRILLVLLFLLSLISAIVPVRYLRTDYVVL
jgi:hypothetical protein